MLRRLTPLVLLGSLFGLGVVIGPATATGDDPAKKPAADKPAEKAKTIKAEKGTLTQVISLKGMIEGEKGQEITIRPKVWTGPLQIKHVIEHGTTVKPGDVLIEFDSEKIDQAIKDAKHDRELSELSIRQAEMELPILERQMPLDLTNAERDAKYAADDYKRFIEIDKPLALESAAQQLKSSAFMLETAKDELKQLSKMYKDKDLTEETEEIVLKRYKHNVEQAEFMFKMAKNRNEQATKIDLPRRELTTKDAVIKADLALVKARDIAPLTLKQKQLGLLKSKYDEAKSRERLADLEKDRQLFKIVATTEGMAYHGRNSHGQWILPMGASLTAGMNLTNSDGILTVVSVAKFSVRADADEKEIVALKPGMTGKATPTAMPQTTLPVVISKRSPAPLNGKFEVYADLTGEKGALVPGMTCSLRFTAKKAVDAVTVPSSAVFENDEDGSKYVYIPGKDGKAEKKTVTVGITVGDKSEILTGLNVGDEILPTKPSGEGDK
ncbi:MAG: hypothetical protein U0798_20540 [Gemmataceae bacterium]